MGFTCVLRQVHPCLLLGTPAFPVSGSLPLSLSSAPPFSNLAAFGSVQLQCDICFPCPVGGQCPPEPPKCWLWQNDDSLVKNHLYILTKREIIIQRDFHRSFCFLGESSAEPTKIKATYFVIGGKIKPSNPAMIPFSSGLAEPDSDTE